MGLHECLVSLGRRGVNGKEHEGGCLAPAARRNFHPGMAALLTGTASVLTRTAPVLTGITARLACLVPILAGTASILTRITTRMTRITTRMTRITTIRVILEAIEAWFLTGLTTVSTWK